MSLYSHCLNHDKEYLLEQWDAEKNTSLTPKGIAATSTERVWWKCENSHSWQTQLFSRSGGAPDARSACEKIDARVEKRRTVEAENKQLKKSNIGGREK